MSKRNLKLDEYGITNKRYKELCGFCEQYPEWKESIAVAMNPLRGIAYSDMPHSPNKGTSDETGNIAIKIADLDTRCDLIESVAKKASPDLWRYLIKGICYEVPVNYLINIEGMPCSRSSYFRTRRIFFYLLDKERN